MARQGAQHSRARRAGAAKEHGPPRPTQQPPQPAERHSTAKWATCRRIRRAEALLAHTEPLSTKPTAHRQGKETAAHGADGPQP